MPVVSVYKLAQLDGFLNARLGDLQDSRASRQILKRSADLQTYSSTRYFNWNLTSGVTIFINKTPLPSEDIKYTMSVGRETLTVYDATGTPKPKVCAVVPDGKVLFSKPLKADDMVEAEFSFRMVPQAELHSLLYAGMMDVSRRMYMDFDPATVPSAVADLVVTAALLKFYDGMNTNASLLYNYKVQDQTHEKSEVAENMRATINNLEKALEKGARAALWRIGNGRARKVTSVKQRYISSSGLGGYSGQHEDGV